MVVIYMHEQAEATVWFSALGMLVLGIFPSLILKFRRQLRAAGAVRQVK